MITAVRKKVKVKADGQIEIRSPEFVPGAIAEVIVLFEKPSDVQNRVKKIMEMKALIKSTQELPQAQTLTDDDILAEIAAYRVEKG
jgi:hypothetical protein